jgi:hypothetical protein
MTKRIALGNTVITKDNARAYVMSVPYSGGLSVGTVVDIFIPHTTSSHQSGKINGVPIKDLKPVK